MTFRCFQSYMQPSIPIFIHPIHCHFHPKLAFQSQPTPAAAAHGQPGLASCTGLAQVHRAHSNRVSERSETCEVPDVTARPDYKGNRGRMRSATKGRVAGLRMHSEIPRASACAARQQCRECKAKESERTRETPKRTRTIVQPLQDCPIFAVSLPALPFTIQSCL